MNNTKINNRTCTMVFKVEGPKVPEWIHQGLLNEGPANGINIIAIQDGNTIQALDNLLVVMGIYYDKLPEKVQEAYEAAEALGIHS